jgi:hypothetical protein
MEQGNALTHLETRRYRIPVEARTGVVTLEGTAAMDEAVDVARRVVRGRDVKTQQADIPRSSRSRSTGSGTLLVRVGHGSSSRRPCPDRQAWAAGPSIF